MQSERSRFLAVEDMLRVVAPHARTYWLGRPRGLPPYSLLNLAAIVILVVANRAMVQAWSDTEVAPMMRQIFILGMPALVLGSALWAWSAVREYWRSEYHVTSVGVFVATGADLFRYDLPDTPPVQKGGSLWLGPLDWEALAPDGRPWARGREALVLSGLGRRTEQVRTALGMARSGEASATEPWVEPSAPTEADTAWWEYLLASLLLIASMLISIVVWPYFVFGGALWFAMLLVRMGWCTVARRFARGAWANSRAPADTRAFSGVNARVVDEVRRWLAHAYHVRANLFHPEDTLASLERFRCYRLSSPKVTLQAVLLRVLPESTTVGDLVQRVDAALAAGPLRGFVDRRGPPWNYRSEVIPSDQIGYLFPLRKGAD